VLDGLASWREADGCAGTASERRDGQVAHTSWAACPAGVAVELYTIEQGRHEWPGADPKPGNDPVSRALDATPVIWAFLRAHPLV
jgi:poly(3-hydroxybutyrate) depolymerase